MPSFPLPPAFTEQSNAVLGNAAPELFRALDDKPPVSIRFNPYKLGAAPEGKQVPWNRYGYYLPERPVFTLDPLFHGGAYYVQEASSMFVEHLYRHFFQPDDRVKVLDVCAAPGGKSTLLSTLVGAEGLVVANEVIRSRASVLVDNIKKWGIGNVAVTSEDPSRFQAFRHYFDLVLVDAPCSGEGMFRKTPEARTEWSPENVKLCAARSRRIVADVWDSLRPGGIFILSTCTFNTQENEDTVRWIMQEFDVEPVEVPVEEAWGIQADTVSAEGENDGTSVFRFYPHRVKGEGFFAAVFRKSDGKSKPAYGKPRKTIFSNLSKPEVQTASAWVGQPEYMEMRAIGDQIYGYYGASFADIKQLAEHLTVLYAGVGMGQLFGRKFKPDPALALFHDVSRSAAPSADLDLATARDFLRKKDLDPQLFTEGTNLVTFHGLPLGWIKRIGGRTNNRFPKELRIVNL